MQKYIDQFQKYWEQFSDSFKGDADQTQALYAILFAAYIEQQRHYHTVQHIVECLKLFHQIKEQLDDPIAVELAIWFHDAVYDPKASDNEAQSADLMQNLCSTLFNQVQIKKVADWIMATKKHQPSSDLDLNYLLDIDLAILGSDRKRFEEYEQQIQQEYSWVEPDLYNIKRSEVLQYFYAMQPIYQTEYFQNILEKRAKNNLETTLLKFSNVEIKH
ncbi:HD domain-containing protein [Acinetobacter silvestris]|uniref:Metal-dependent hydrolase n=1 Tax=Acinetobacter silvestris TaxID=1977882 RepID=A0A1Y3CKB9_9GAMM|nr:metal-dependent hydrolase [Acinetobacter silvestris]OTG66593.1 metal-dependent hydrolase [Acinetobacter silvestris]